MFRLDGPRRWALHAMVERGPAPPWRTPPGASMRTVFEALRGGAIVRLQTLPPGSWTTICAFADGSHCWICHFVHPRASRGCMAVLESRKGLASFWAHGPGQHVQNSLASQLVTACVSKSPQSSCDAMGSQCLRLGFPPGWFAERTVYPKMWCRTPQRRRWPPQPEACTDVHSMQRCAANPKDSGVSRWPVLEPVALRISWQMSSIVADLFIPGLCLHSPALVASCVLNSGICVRLRNVGRSIAEAHSVAICQVSGEHRSDSHQIWSNSEEIRPPRFGRPNSAISSIFGPASAVVSQEFVKPGPHFGRDALNLTDPCQVLPPKSSDFDWTLPNFGKNWPGADQTSVISTDLGPSLENSDVHLRILCGLRAGTINEQSGIPL